MSLLLYSYQYAKDINNKLLGITLNYVEIVAKNMR
jgi:hypothetical protein